MKNLFLGLFVLTLVACGSHAFAQNNTGTTVCADIPNGYIRDGSGFGQSTNCGYLLKINPDGSLNVNGSSGGVTGYTTSTGYQQTASFSTSTGFTPPAGSTICFIQTETVSVRYRTDGVAPTATVGQLLPVGSQLQLSVNLAGVRFIPTSGSTVLDVDCYK